ncbi:MAG: hypothetical protein RL531_1111 [Actinomycetota bacterium]
MARVPMRTALPRLGAVALVLIAVADLASGLGLIGRDVPTPRRSSPEPTIRTRAPEPAAGTRAVRVVAPGARVRPGDRVDLLVTLDPDRYPDSEPTRAVGEAFTVLSVDRDDADPSVRGMTLAVPRALVPRVAFAATAGTLTVAVVPDRRRV